MEKINGTLDCPTVKEFKLISFPGRRKLMILLDMIWSMSRKTNAPAVMRINDLQEHLLILRILAIIDVFEGF